MIVRVVLFLLGLLVGACGAVAPVPAPCPPAAPLPPSHEETARAMRGSSVALVDVDLSDGELQVRCSGVWVGAERILTAAHCVRGMKAGDMQMYATPADVYPGTSLTMAPSPTPHPALLYAVDAAHDLAMLKAPGAAPHGTAQTRMLPIEQGMFAAAMGNPLGLWFSYSSGVIARVSDIDDLGFGVLWIQTTAPISPGNSGGGLFDEEGALIGICSATFTRGQNLNLFVHQRYVDAFVAVAK